MTQRFVIRNQDGYYLAKSKEWVDGRNPVAVVNVLHYDQALNELIEVNSKDIWIRGTILEVETNEKGRVKLEIIVPAAQEQLPMALAEEGACNDVKLVESEAVQKVEAQNTEVLSVEVQGVEVQGVEAQDAEATAESVDISDIMSSIIDSGDAENVGVDIK